MPQTFVISAPSGTGKTSLNTRLANELADVEVSISATSRAMRPGEKDGMSYVFVSKEVFERMIEGKELLEYAEVFGQYYGTRVKDVDRILDQGKNVILEIDVQGWRSIKKIKPDAVGIFILPPSLQVIWDRLEVRGTDSLESRKQRLKAARDEISASRSYDYFIVNESFDEAFSSLKAIVRGDIKAALSRAEADARIEKLLQEFEDSRWNK